ncbi:ABC transporter ATP-binding protein [Pseudanabaena sp. FACHB-1998]|nr:ABC transporter ATP-binding protein [Pseudanabaena sp. FACHB-1998]
MIKVENLSKRYVIGHQAQNGNVTLRDVIANSARSLKQKIFNSNQKFEDPAHEEFWALKDVSFEIKQGDRVGIIGRNGAGKSTLLKILSRITEPTSGRISIKGRVASLLEVGTGFHAELTGRENIFLNGAILGMSRAEINKKFDEIVDFAEVEKFLDTPVKHYSSGMYVRLAFAVAAHLEPEILIVDEVLAVGDSSFQKKCLGKMENFSDKEGRTVLFVSHNMATISTLCHRAIWLVDGQVKLQGSVEKVTSKYLNLGIEQSGEVVISETHQKNQRFCFLKVSLIDVYGNINSVFDVRHPIKIRLIYQVKHSFKVLEIGFKIINSAGISVFTVDRSFHLSSEVAVGIYQAEVEIPPLFLAPNYYSVNVGAHIPNVEIISLYQSLISFEIEETGSNMSAYKGADIGIVLVDFPWQELVVSIK